jgi:hypothetical protein
MSDGHVKIDRVKCIGKESNSLEDVDAGLIHSEKNAYTEYVDPKRDEWTTKIKSALKKAKLSVLVKECGKRLSRSKLIELLARRSRPHCKTIDLLVPILKGLSLFRIADLREQLLVSQRHHGIYTHGEARGNVTRCQSHDCQQHSDTHHRQRVVGLYVVQHAG